MAAAKKLFAERGYDAATTREIAAAASCAEGLIHRYFKGKAGLLLALIQNRVTQEVADLSDQLPVAKVLREELIRLVNWEVQRKWEDREFLKVIVPRAMLDLSIARVLGSVGASRRIPTIMDRLKLFEQCLNMPAEELEAFARLIETIRLQSPPHRSAKCRSC